MVGVGLLLMSGPRAGTAWIHLIPGLVLGGIGTGLVNPPLASTAVGVVQPQRAGMASGINTTFRQVGIAASIAALGSVFTARLSAATKLTGRPTRQSDGPSAPNQPRLIVGANVTDQVGTGSLAGQELVVGAEDRSGLGLVLVVAVGVALQSAVDAVLDQGGQDVGVAGVGVAPA